MSDKPTHLSEQEEAEAVEYFLDCAQVVPADNGAQLEWHQDGWDIEVEFNAEGKIVAAFIGRDESK